MYNKLIIILFYILILNNFIYQIISISNTIKSIQITSNTHNNNIYERTKSRFPFSNTNIEHLLPNLLIEQSENIKRYMKQNQVVNQIDNTIDKSINNSRNFINTIRKFYIRFVDKISCIIVKYGSIVIAWGNTHRTTITVFGITVSVALIGYIILKRIERWYKSLADYELLLDKTDYNYQTYGTLSLPIKSFLLKSLNNKINKISYIEDYDRYIVIYNNIIDLFDLPCFPHTMYVYILQLTKDINSLIYNIDTNIYNEVDSKIDSQLKKDILIDITYSIMLLQIKQNDVILRLLRTQLLKSINISNDLLIYYNKKLSTKSQDLRIPLVIVIFTDINRYIYMTIRNANRNINKLYHVVSNRFTKPISRNTTSNTVNITNEPIISNTTVYEPHYNNWYKKIINYFKYQYPNQFNSIDNKFDVTIISQIDSRKDKKLVSTIDSKGGSITVSESDSALYNDIESKLESELNIEDKISLLNDILNDFYIKTSKIQNHLDGLSSINMTLVNDINDLNVLIQWNEKAMELSKFSLLDINAITRIDSKLNNNVENKIDSQLEETIRNNSIDSRIGLLINSTNINRLVYIINTTLPYKLMDMLDRCIVSTNILSQAIDPNYSNNPTTISSHSNWFKYSSGYLDNTLVNQLDTKVYIRITNTTNKNIKQIIDVLDTTNIQDGRIYLTNYLQLRNQPFNYTIQWTFKDVDRKDDKLIDNKVASNKGIKLVSKVKVIVSLDSSNNNRYLRNLINKCVKLSHNKLINYNKLSDRSMHIYSDDELELLRKLGISNQYNQLYNHKQPTSSNNNIIQYKSIYHTNYHSNYYIISNIKYFTNNLMNYYNSNHLNIKSKHKLNILKFLSFTLWLRVTSIIGLIYVSLEAAKEPEDIINKLNYIKGNMKDFIDRRLVIPSTSILNDVILNKRVSITDKEALEDAKKSLGNMIYDFLVQHKLSMSDNEKKKIAKAMDMSLISSEYEKELKRPIQNIVSGRIARIVLIQLQFVKKELLVAMEAIDELFNANQVNLQLLAVMPAIFSLILVQSFGKFLINFIRSSSRGKFIESATSIHREIRYELRELERLLSITNTLDQNHLIYGQMISKLYYIHNLLVSNSQLFEYEILQLLHEDFRDLLINTLTIDQRLHIIYRINRSYVFLQNYKRGLQMWPVG